MKRPKTVIVVLTLLAALAAVSANTIPAWLDEAIGSWNAAHPENPVVFAAFKDSFVWYTVAPTDALTTKDIRGRVDGIVRQHGYEATQDEELVTTMRAPSANGPFKTMKCYTRGYLRDPKKGSSGHVDQHLTTLVCEDGRGWSAGFRMLQ